VLQEKVSQRSGVRRFRRTSPVLTPNDPSADAPRDHPLPCIVQRLSEVVVFFKSSLQGRVWSRRRGAQGGIDRGIESASCRSCGAIENIPKVEPSECNGCRVGVGLSIGSEVRPGRFSLCVELDGAKRTLGSLPGTSFAQVPMSG
jgi:hypothetical protein